MGVGFTFVVGIVRGVVVEWFMVRWIVSFILFLVWGRREVGLSCCVILCEVMGMMSRLLL